MCNGYVLSRVAYAIRLPVEDTNIVGDKITVRDAFPYNPASPTSPETAKRCASIQRYDRVTNTYSTDECEIVERDNEPFSITITDLVKRSEGGRAYKVIDSDNRRFDLREDQLMEVLKKYGIAPAGVVDAKFVWATVSSQVKLIMVGGHLYETFAHEAEKLQNACIAIKLQFGHVYRMRSNKHVLFLGYAKSNITNKTYCALLTLPKKPESPWKSLEEIEKNKQLLGEHYEYAKHFQNIDVNWESMTWPERLTTIETSFSSHRNHQAYCTSISLMSTPKCLFETSEVEVELAQRIKENANCQRDYRDGYEELIPHKEFALVNGSRPYLSYYHDRNDAQSIKRAQIYDEKLKAYCEQFRDDLEWKVEGT